MMIDQKDFFLGFAVGMYAAYMISIIYDVIKDLRKRKKGAQDESQEKADASDR